MPHQALKENNIYSSEVTEITQDYISGKITFYTTSVILKSTIWNRSVPPSEILEKQYNDQGALAVDIKILIKSSAMLTDMAEEGQAISIAKPCYSVDVMSYCVVARAVREVQKKSQFKSDCFLVKGFFSWKGRLEIT